MIIGGGVSGLCTAGRLLDSGIRDVIILERNAAVGPRSADRLPGAPCDVPSTLYPYVLNRDPRRPEWTAVRPSARELGDYVRRLAHHCALKPLIRFGQETVGLDYDQTGARWVARTRAGESFAARSVVLALGSVPVARIPDIPGLERFGGSMIHTADWDDRVDVSGKRVAVVGSGASAVQLVPELVKHAARMKVFQRTPRWMLPWPDHAAADWDRALLRTLPFGKAAARQAVLCAHEPWAVNGLVRPALVTAIERLATAHLHRQVRDRWRRRLLKPTYRAGERPVLLSSHYYPALARDNCELVHWPIASISSAGVRTADALEHHVDVLVLATGSDMVGAGTRFPIVGRDGRTLSREHTDRAGSYKGVNVAGFPNMFLIPGPAPRPERSADLIYLNPRLDYTVRALREITSGAARSLDVRGDAQRTYHQTLRTRLADTVWRAQGIRDGRHVTVGGFDPTVYPGLAPDYAAELATFRLSDYDVEPGVATR